MLINEIEQGKLYSPLVQQQTESKGIQPTGEETFADTLNGFISDVNLLQKDAAEQTERLIKGEPVDIHDVMITTEKARTSFDLLMELRNRALDLYREVNRLQV